MRLVGTIQPQWAEQLASETERTHGREIWEYNKYNAEEISSDINLRELGGLVVQLDRRIVFPDEVEEISARHSLVNLAFDQLGFMTDTKQLALAASVVDLMPPRREASQRRAIVGQLEKRMKPDVDAGHGGNEYWLFPAHALRLVALPDYSTSEHS